MVNEMIHFVQTISEMILLKGWKDSLPPCDQQWISRALIKAGKHGKAIDWGEVNQGMTVKICHPSSIIKWKIYYSEQ